VDIFSWDQFVGNKFHKLYDAMALRHLYSKESSSASTLRNEGWLKKLEEFIKVSFMNLTEGDCRFIKASVTG
jgi:hypothetical protein